MSRKQTALLPGGAGFADLGTVPEFVLAVGANAWPVSLVCLGCEHPYVLLRNELTAILTLGHLVENFPQ